MRKINFNRRYLCLISLPIPICLTPCKICHDETQRLICAFCTILLMLSWATKRKIRLYVYLLHILVLNISDGKTGVFDVEDLVTLLRSANASDVVVIRLPKAAQLGEHMVIASAKSQRHLTAMSKDVQWIVSIPTGLYIILL